MVPQKSFRPMTYLQRLWWPVKHIYGSGATSEWLSMVSLAKCSEFSAYSQPLLILTLLIIFFSQKGQVDVPDDQRLYINTVSNRYLFNHGIEADLYPIRILHFQLSFVECKVSWGFVSTSECHSEPTTSTGSGKSHTVSTILENALISGFPAIGSLTKPLSVLVLHYGEGGLNSLPNEAAWLSSSISSHIKGPPVRVYVSRSSLQTMRTVYGPLGERVSVEPLLFSSSELDVAAILSMMAVGSTDSAPLYMQIIMASLWASLVESSLMLP